MRWLVISTAAMILASIVGPLAALGWPSVGAAPASDKEAQIKAVLDATDSSDRLDAFHDLLKGAKPEALRLLQMHDSDTIAIQAAWQEVELTVPEKEGREVFRPERDKLAWFLGLLEGRAHVRAPRWWADAILDARANRRGNVYAGGFNVGPFEKDKIEAAKPPLPASFEMQGGKLILRVGMMSAALPRDTKERIKAGGAQENVSGLITGSRCYVAAYNSVGYPYRLGCVDRANAKLLWVIEIWGSWWSGASGVHTQSVEIIEQGNRVVVFGIASTGFHVEAFRLEDGANIFRFSNGYTPR